MTKMVKILPCPICKEEATLFPWQVNDLFSVGCSNDTCYLTCYGKPTSNEAIQEWNSICEKLAYPLIEVKNNPEDKQKELDKAKELFLEYQKTKLPPPEIKSSCPVCGYHNESELSACYACGYKI